MAKIKRLSWSHKTKKGEKVDYSWHEDNKDKTEHKGKWQLRVAYKVTNDNILIDPYIVVTSDKKKKGFKKSTECTIKYQYMQLKTSSKTYNWNNKWKEETKKKSINVKKPDTYFFFDKKKSLNTYKILITAKIGSKSSSVAIFGTSKPPRPIIPPNVAALEHDVDRSSVWKIHFGYKPKDGTKDYAAPVDRWHIARTTGSTQSGWTEIYSASAKHDVNGFRDAYEDQGETSPGNRYKWKVWFSNSNGNGPARIYPPNTSNETRTEGGLKTKEQLDRFAEWAYMPPSQISNFENVVRSASNVRFEWRREVNDVINGLYRGYFIQYRTNANIDKAISNSDSWSQKKIGKKLKNSSSWKTYILEDTTPNQYQELISCFALCNENTRYQFRLVPFNFDKGRPKKITYNGPRVQKATPSDPYPIIYFKPAKADDVTAVKVSSTENYAYKVTVDISSALNGPVNSIIIDRRYQFTDGTNSTWQRCWASQAEDEIPDTGIYLNRKGKLTPSGTYKKIFEFKDYQSAPEKFPENSSGKPVQALQYSVKLGTTFENEGGSGDGVFPDLDVAFSGRTIMTGWVSSFSRPKKPTLILPELNKAFPENTEMIRLAWTHNPTDGTDQSEALLDIYVFSEESLSAIGGEIPSNFLEDYTFDSGIWKNPVTVSGIQGCYDLSISQITEDGDLDPESEPNYLYRILEIDTANQVVTLAEQGPFSANDKVLWKVRTKGGGGSDAEYSPYSDEFRPFNIFGIPSIELSVSNLNVSTGILSNLPATVTWNYSDASGTMQSLNLYLMKNDQILESYAMDIETQTSFSFSYLFDNGESYSILAEASSTTTLSANTRIGFTVNYANVIFSQDLSVSAEFKEYTGFVEISLSEETNEGSNSDSSDILIEEGSTTVEYNGTSFYIDYDTEYDSESKRLKLKALINIPVSDILMASAVSALTDADFFPTDDRYPAEDIYPNRAIVTNDSDTEYMLFDDVIDEDPTYIYLWFSVNPDRGSFFEIVEDVRTEIGPSVSAQINYVEKSSDISFPLTGILVDDLDIEAQPDDIIYIDKPATDAYLYRLYRGEKSYIGHFTPDFSDNVATTTITDRFCPVNREFTYQLVQLTEDGDISFSEFSFEFNTLYWYCYWGDNYDNVVKARWNPSGSATYGRPERQAIRYSGRKYPVIYDSDAMEETYNFTTELFEDDYMIDYLDDDETALETIELYRQLMMDGGVGFWKSFDGDVYFAAFDFNYSIDYTDRIAKYPCSLSVTRIEGEEIFTTPEGEEVS